MRFLFFILIFSLLSTFVKAQPFNDNCVNAGVINIPNGGWNYGVFNSDTVDLTAATLQVGEFIPVQQVANAKTVWFKFSIPTTREVIITLQQPGVPSMPPTAAGWTLYRTNACLPTIAEVVNPPIINIEGYTHTCLRQGDYLIQVNGSLIANDSVFIQLQTGPSSANEVQYDHALQPLNFGLVSGLFPSGPTNQFYETGCQSLFQGEVPCPNSNFTQSTWHIFTTDNFIDFYRFEVAESPWVLPNTPPRTFGYRLYKGNCMLDSIADGVPAGGSNLTEIVACSTLTQTYASTYAADFSKCILEPNTTYSIQLFFPKGYSRQVNVRMYETGGGEEISENPNAIAPIHQLGSLPFGVNTSSDFLTCEGRLSNWTACSSMVPPSGYYIYSGDTFDLASYRTFTISTTTNVHIDDIITNQPGLLFRLYSGDVGLGCGGLTLYQQFYGSTWLYCLPSGQYTLQILGRSKIHQIHNYHWQSNLGKQHSVSINVSQYYSTAFGLHTNSEIDQINGGSPLLHGVQYYSTWDTFDCSLTYLPDGDVCSSTYQNNNRAIYRRIVINQNGILVVGGGVWNRFSYRLYSGDASTAPVVNNRFQGLVDQAGCQSTYYPFKVCVTPGVYTLVVFGDSTDVGYADREWFRFYNYPPTAYTTPATAEVLDSVTLTHTTVSATPTRFSCLDNPNTILGYAPCNGSTKLIYREVYFAQPSLAQFTPSLTSLNGSSPAVYYRFFSGRISDGSISALFRNCATSGFKDCIPTGWYTIVAYGFGNTYTAPGYTSGTGGNIGDLSGFTITIDTNVQQFRTIALSEDANGGNPMNWYLRSSGGSTPQYPRNDTTYTLATEFWDCANDLPFDAGITPCVPSHNRVSYRVFTLGKPSYLYIYDLNPYPYGYQSRLYAGDLRLQTPPFTIIQACITDQMRICASPGTYTLVTFAGDNHIGYTHTPKIYIDSLGTSKFDFAAQAYDFGDIPNNNTEYLGNPLDPPGPFGRAPSSDFFFCSTGASATDPNNNCPVGTNPPGNALPSPTNPRRNLWYTFTVTGPGRVYVSVYNKTPKSIGQSPFSVYYSPNTSIPPKDSIAPPLQFVATSTGYYCTNAQTISYYLEPCAGVVQRRYYIQVQNNSYNEPNVQIEVGVRFEPAPPAYVLFNHYSQANQINANPTVENVPPYTPLNITSGTYTGYMGNLNCATKDSTDQNPCGTKTLWYAFDVASTGQIRINYDRPAPNGTTFHTQDLILLRQVVPGDSSSSGLQQIPLTAVNYNNNPDFNPGTNYTWGQACVFPGRYYIMFTGCQFPTETVVPRIWMVPQVGDLCSDPMVVAVPTSGSFTATTNINCHTIGEGPGEDGSNMGCLGSPVGMKSHWFRVDLSGTVKYDLDIQLSENTNATSSDLKYRVAYGNCNYMTFDNCVSEGLHIILNLKCRLPGSFYIQVLMPSWATGDISLNLTATQVSDSNCIPIDPLRPRASFTHNASCVDTAVYFFNYSSIGTGITYFWDFGDSSYSTQFEPIHQYADTGTYLVTLIVDNTFQKDTIQQYVTVYPVPGASFAVSDTVIAGAPITFDNTSSDTLAGALFYWNFCSPGSSSPCGANIPFYFGADPPPVTYNQGGWKYVCLTVTNGNCDSTFCKWIYVAYGNIFTGGPYDGNDVDAVYANCLTNIFVGGPYDGNDVDAVYANCLTNIFVGGPYDGNDLDAVYANCITNIFVGGPYDGFGMSKVTAFCTTPTWFTGGPFDGAAVASVFGTCVIPDTNIFVGGPFDGAGHDAIYSNCITNVFVGGPYDGADHDAVYSNCVTNIFVGGPYDGNDVDAVYANCLTNVFVGGPYDGFGRSTARAFCEVPVFVGGPFDGHAVASFNNYQVQGDTVCFGQSATLTTSSPTNWYNVQTGGTPLATNTSTYTTAPLNQTSIFYAQNLCAGGRNPVIVQVNQLLSPDFNNATACVNQPMQFFNQTIVTTNPTPSIGGPLSDISFLGTTGAPAPTGGISFSSQQILNYGYLTDNLNTNIAWQSANTLSPGTQWVQWRYVNPRSVTRFYYWNDPAYPNRSPKQLRLYYSNGGPWILVKVIIPPYPSGGVFDTGNGNIPETNGIFANRWKLEVDVDANGPMWREFQVFSGTPGLGGNVSWDFGDGGTSTAQNPTHTFTGTGPYTVTLTVNNNGCTNTFSKVITPCDAPLPVTNNFLTAQFRKDTKDVQLDWAVEGTFVKASIEKYNGNAWVALDTFDFERDPNVYARFDSKPWYHANNLYRVKYTDVDGSFHYSNIAEVWIEQIEQQLLLYPNPITDADLHIQWTSRVAGQTKWTVLNQLGQTLIQSDWRVEEGVNELQIPVRKLAEGIYYFRLEHKEGEVTQKFVVVGK